MRRGARFMRARPASVRGEWTGAPLNFVLAAAKPKAAARYVMFHCADNMAEEGDPAQFYYESLDLPEAPIRKRFWPTN